MSSLSDIDAARLATPNSAATRFAAAISVAPEGLPLIAGIAAAGLVVMVITGLAIGLWLPGIAIIVAAIPVAAFFRDPERTPPASGSAIVSAADGRVTNIVDAPIPGDDAGEIHHQISVFMSPLNVHVNRAPATGEIVSIVHTAGQFRAAFRDYASEHNERNVVILNAGGQRYAIVQVAGYFARRIVCRVRERQQVSRGERIGMIMFGSRVDHFLPLGCAVTVKIGDRVCAGESTIGVLVR